jgi:hypothetical protein
LIAEPPKTVPIAIRGRSFLSNSSQRFRFDRKNFDGRALTTVPDIDTLESMSPCRCISLDRARSPIELAIGA